MVLERPFYSDERANLPWSGQVQDDAICDAMAALREAQCLDVSMAGVYYVTQSILFKFCCGFITPLLVELERVYSSGWGDSSS